VRIKPEEPQRLKDVILLRRKRYADSRGYFVENWTAEDLRQQGIDFQPWQLNSSCSRRGVVRGMHTQVRCPQAKLVWLSSGCVLDIVADVRSGSPTFAQSNVCQLTAEGGEQLYVPKGFVHGFCALSEQVCMHYLVDAAYDADDELTIHWQDPSLALNWPMDAPIVSGKDAMGRKLSELALTELPQFHP